MRIGKFRLNKKKTILILLLPVVVWSLSYFLFFDRTILKDGGQSLQFFDRNNKSMRFLLSKEDQYRERISISEISPHFLRACVLVEDSSFYTHKGFKLSSLFRALFQNLKKQRVVSGGSTISMQLAKILKKHNKRNIFNKISELFFAIKLEFHLKKAQILEEYINRLPFGNMVYGIQQASEFYFDKAPSELSLNQAVYLALIPKAPTYYNPIKNHKKLRVRWKMILNEFKNRSYISGEEMKRVLKEGISFTMKKDPFIAPHFIEMIKRKSLDNFGSSSRIQTTIDLDIQQKVKGIVSRHLDRLRYYQVKSAAVVVIDNYHHEITAYLGSPSYFNKKSDGCVDYANSLRQPGSTLKPFVYGLALENGYHSSSILPDIKFPAKGGFFPKNHDGMEHGPLRLRTALACSYNIPAFYLAVKLTPQKILKRLQECGFVYLDRESEYYGETIALGSGEVKLLDLVTAYSIFANDGLLFPPSLIKELTKDKGRRVFTKQSAYLIWSILSDPGSRAPSFGYYSSMDLPFPVAFKTGTSKGFRDKWAVGVNSEYTIGVWLGNPGGENIKEKIIETGNSATIVRDIFLAVQKNWEKGGIKKPDGIVSMEVCALSGELPGPCCTETVTEEFDSDNLPERICSYHKIDNGNRVTSYPEIFKSWALRNKLESNLQITQDEKIKISFPQNGDVFYLHNSIPLESQEIYFKVMGLKKGEEVRYFLDEKFYQVKNFPDFPVWRLKRGKHILRIKINRNIVDQINFSVF